MHVKLSQYRDVIAALQDPTLRQGLYDDGQVIMDSVLLTLHGDAHRIRRRLEQKLFTRPNIRFYETQVIPTLLKQYIDPFMTEGGGDILPLTLKPRSAIRLASSWMLITSGMVTSRAIFSRCSPPPMIFCF